jgi:F-type H+-transporting ATPase subunit b
MTSALASIGFLFAEAAEAAAEKEPPNPILPVGNELFWTVVAFALTMVLLALTFRKVSGPMDARSDAVRADLAAVESAKAELAAAQATYEARLAQARAEAANILGEAQAVVDAERADALAVVNAELAERRAVVGGEVEAAKAAALAGLSDQVRSIALDAAGRVVGGRLDTGRATAAVDAYLAGATNGGGNG